MVGHDGRHSPRKHASQGAFITGGACGYSVAVFLSGASHGSQQSKVEPLQSSWSPIVITPVNAIGLAMLSEVVVGDFHLRAGEKRIPNHEIDLRGNFFPVSCSNQFACVPRDS